MAPPTDRLVTKKYWSSSDTDPARPSSFSTRLPCTRYAGSPRQLPGCVADDPLYQAVAELVGRGPDAPGRAGVPAATLPAATDRSRVPVGREFLFREAVEPAGDGDDEAMVAVLSTPEIRRRTYSTAGVRCRRYCSNAPCAVCPPAPSHMSWNCRPPVPPWPIWWACGTRKFLCASAPRGQIRHPEPHAAPLTTFSISAQPTTPTEETMKIDDAFSIAKDAMTVERVYAEPVERDGTTVIGVAAVSGGAGGGGGSDPEGQQGSGAGFGVGAKPVGAFVIRDGRVRWQPAVDVNRLIAVVGAVALAALIVGARFARRP